MLARELPSSSLVIEAFFCVSKRNETQFHQSGDLDAVEEIVERAADEVNAVGTETLDVDCDVGDIDGRLGREEMGKVEGEERKEKKEGHEEKYLY